MPNYLPIVERVLDEPDAAAGWRVDLREPWYLVTPPDHEPRRQGWKLHLSATPGSAPSVLERAARVLLRHDCAFKFASTPAVTARLVSARMDRARSGKFLTAYPADDDRLRALAKDLHEATLGLPGPAILSDRRYHRGSLVHYRYGCFHAPLELTDEGSYEMRLRDPDGASVRDDRLPWFAPPPWAVDPFPATDTPTRRRGDPVRLADRYVVSEAIRHSNRGGVYRARDERTGHDVLIKEARPHVGADLDGRDARDWLRHEADMLDLLAPHVITPQRLDLFSAGGHLFLVEEFVDGTNLQDWHREHDGQPSPESAWQLAGALSSVLDRVHAVGLVLRDLKPSNVIMRSDGTPLLIDLEAATRPGTRTAVVGTAGFVAPEYLRSGADHAPEPSADCFSLGATLLHATTGIHPVLVPDTVPGRWIGERLAALAHAAAPGSAALAALLPLVLGLTADEPDRWTLAHTRRFLRTGGPRVAPVSAGPELPDVDVDLLVRDGLAHLADTMDPSGEYLWPQPSSLPHGDPCNVQTGAAGVVALLRRAVGHGLESARPALRSAVRWMRWRLPQERRVLPGLHFGRSGAVWALHDAAVALGDSATADWAAASALEIPVAWPNLDVCHGVAGAGLTQLRFWHATGDERFAARAAAAADTVLRQVRLARSGVDWLADGGFRDDLAGLGSYGFAHGVAGVGAFLLAAGRDLGRPDLVEVAVGGGHALCAVARTRGDAAWWPKGPGRAERPGLDFWCNGASGVGTFLVRLWRETGDATFLDHARRAARAAYLDRWRLGPGICHGVAGNAELLLDLAQATGEDGYRRQAAELATCLFTRAVRVRGRLLVPDDTLREVCPSYQVGFAGVLDFLLRLRHGGDRAWLVDRRFPLAA
ncbi:protein kinase/lanthionine synthetase C family protein [Solihabitans fulvus]|uniref:non-specific serine/threonine protein kinase n=1 Tax=Solihabitans fulvus TaxID=1892852 RepID=A0A5B2XRV5_9PSEU|nr:class IV lanthionine synthetase LanL [Solihabitans fulvus]KAA2265700.1 protein kinase/lanthionine synthetase C family protein [Solihabitans fulvus]